MKEKVLPVCWKDVEMMKEAGYEFFGGGDAEKATSEGFVLMRRRNGADFEWVVLCPTFLRGPLGLAKNGASY